MKSISGPRATASARAYTAPGHLVRIDFETPVYLSSIDLVSFAGQAWTPADIQVSGIKQDARGRSGGQLTLGNADLTWSALILGEGVADRRIRIWSFDATATGPADITPIFDGVCDAATIGHPCMVQLASERSSVAFSPRRFIGPGTGFNHLSPAGREIRIGNDTLTLDRPGASDTGRSVVLTGSAPVPRALPWPWFN